LAASCEDLSNQTHTTSHIASHLRASIKENIFFDNLFFLFFNRNCCFKHRCLGSI